MHLRSRRFKCVDLTTGDQKWTTEPSGQYWSLVALGDRILALDCGRTASGPRHTREVLPSGLAKISGQETWGHLAVCGEQVFVRATEWNFCLPLIVVRMFYLKLYFCPLIAFFAIDMVWLGLVARGFYQKHLGYLLRPDPNWSPPSCSICCLCWVCWFSS